MRPDIGAHIGLYTLPLSRAVGPDGRVHAFEPAAGTRRYLERHLQYNDVGNVEVHPWVVGASDEEAVPFYEMPDDSGMNAVVRRGERYRETTRRQVSLDTFCRERGLHPNVVKIDAEGAEASILHGMEAVLQTARPAVFLSLHPDLLTRCGSSVRDVCDLLESNRYELLEVTGESCTEPGKNEYLALPVEQVDGDA